MCAHVHFSSCLDAAATCSCHFPCANSVPCFTLLCPNWRAVVTSRQALLKEKSHGICWLPTCANARNTFPSVHFTSGPDEGRRVATRQARHKHVCVSSGLLCDNQGQLPLLPSNLLPRPLFDSSFLSPCWKATVSAGKPVGFVHSLLPPGIDAPLFPALCHYTRHTWKNAAAVTNN